MTEQKRERRYRVQHIEGLGEVRLPAPPTKPYSPKSNHEIRKLADPDRDINPLRLGDKLVYGFLIVAALAKLILWIAN